MNNPASITIMPPVEGAEIPPLEGAAEKGFREIARIWQSGTTGEPGTVTATLRGLHAEPQLWVPAVTTFVRTIAALYGNGAFSEPQIDGIGGLLLLGALQLIASTSKPIEGGTPPAVEMPHSHSRAPVAKQAEEDNRHPGELPLPEEAEEDADAKQVLSIWLLPEVSDCPGCGDSHAASSYIQGQMSDIAPGDLGILLAEATTMHAHNAAKDPGGRLKVLATIQKAYHDKLSEGMARA